MKIIQKQKGSRWLVILFLAAFIIYVIWPQQYFQTNYSTILLDSKGKLLSAKIAVDEQWRFPPIDSVPNNFKQCLLVFEDQYFDYHLGVNPVAMVRATWQNLKEGKVVSGGSTISMQIIRLSKQNPPRTVWQKLLEILAATKLELTHSKKEILGMYCSHAPYGGNVVGLQAAAWRYFGRPASCLSLAEVAMLAVLPNAPALIHPGRNRSQLRNKRDRLLKRMLDAEQISEQEFELAKLEPIPTKPNVLPSYAPHLLQTQLAVDSQQPKLESTLDGILQRQAINILGGYQSAYSEAQIHNSCAIVIEVATGEVKAYIGNSAQHNYHAPAVDLLLAPRSSGSILKPFLYAAAMDDALILPNSLMDDFLVKYGNFYPANFSKQYRGVVDATTALYKSLNIPAVNLLSEFGVSRFLGELNGLGFTHLNRSANDYGLSLILGGGEVTPFETANAYLQLWQASLGLEVRPAYCIKKHNGDELKTTISHQAWRLTADMLTNTVRPYANANWQKFSSSNQIAWKTGTSFGHRDAWAVGMSANYVVCTWVGNATGEGRPGLTGASAAAPIMFKLFDLLPNGNWPEIEPQREIEVCEKSGYLPSEACDKMRLVAATTSSENLPICKFHQTIFLNKAGKRATQNCSMELLRDTNWFVLSPLQGYYYARKNSDYKPVPSWTPECQTTTNNPLSVIHPPEGAKLKVPVNLQGSRESVLITAHHQNTEAEVFWHCNDSFLGITQGVHERRISLATGVHTFKLIDNLGNVASRRVEVR